MTWFLGIASFLLEWIYVFVFFGILHTFLPLRKNRLMQILAFLAVSILATMIIYSNDWINLFGTLAGFVLYIAVFHRGRWIEKLSAILVFCPALIAVNYLMMDIGCRIFFAVCSLPQEHDVEWNQGLQLTNDVIYAFSLLLRLLFWMGTLFGLKKYLLEITANLTVKMWILIDVLMAAPFVAIFTIICFMPENPVIVYPICGASVFSSFGCIYLAAYICNSVQTAYRAQELEMKQAYWNGKINDEERVRGIYHDMKNHLLLLQAQAGNGQEVQKSICGLLNQIQEYESYYHTGNEFLDIIVREKAKAAQERRIDFHAGISFEDGGFIELLDISTIFGNALDNAIEASERLPAEQRLITVKASRVRDMLVIFIENNAPDDLSVSVRTTKKDRFLHGLGLSNIRRAVERYDGQCSVNAGDGRFVLKILIPVP